MPSPAAGSIFLVEADVGVLDASGSACTDGVVVKTWQDQTVNGNHAVQNTAGNRPIFKASGIGGKPSIKFTLANATSLPSPFGANLGDFTVFTVFQATANGAAYARLVDKVYDQGFWMGEDGANLGNYGGGVREGSAPFGIYVPAAHGVPHLLYSMRSGTTHTVNVDGTSNSNTVSATVGTGLTIAIGSDANAGTSNFEGYISAVYIYGSALTGTNLSDTIGYLSTKYLAQYNPGHFMSFFQF